jgi:HEAT repeat protein
MRLLALLLITTATLAGEGGLDPHPWDLATRSEGRRFTVTTNTFPELATSLVTHLDAAYAHFERRFGPLPPHRSRRMEVWLFRTKEEYLTRADGVRGALGHFDAALDRSALIWDGGTGETGWPIAVHEACHHYFRRRFPGVLAPTWYSEGIACYFEGLQDLTAPHAVARLRLETARAALLRGNARLEAVLSARADLREGKLQMAGFTPTRFYALAWSFVHFLNNDARLKKGFLRFERRFFESGVTLGNREAVARSILIEECGDLSHLERGWRAHVEALPALHRYELAAVQAEHLASASPFQRYRALRELGRQADRAELEAELLRRLGDRDLIVRQEATRLIARRMRDAAIPALIRNLDLLDTDGRLAAIRALARPEATAAVPRLIREAESGERDAALRALVEIGHPDAWPLLRAAVADEKLGYLTRALCAGALDRDPLAVEVLRAASESRVSNLSRAARAALLRLGSTIRVEPEPSGESAPVVAGPTPIPVLLDLLADPEASGPDLAHACRLLGERKAVEAVPSLRRLCRPDRDDEVRLEAIRALARITGETRGFQPGQSAREREAAYRAWASG